MGDNSSSTTKGVNKTNGENVSANGCESENKTTNSFHCNDLLVTRAQPEQMQEKPADMGAVRFGEHFTDHMVEVDWTEAEGWSQPKICPIHEINLHPASKVFHFAPEVFEGMKAFRGEDGVVRLFRPEKNMARMRKGAARASLPDFAHEQLLALIVELVRLDIDWVPKESVCSLYIRPTLIGTDASFDLTNPTRAKLFVITCPVGAYFRSGFHPVSVMADPNFARAFPGGVGGFKMGSNYAPTIFVSKLAESHGCHQVLWLSGEDEKLTEVGVMNVFLLWKDKLGVLELVTPPIEDRIVLNGVMRDSCLELVRDWNEFRVSVRYPNIAELREAIKEGRLLQMFGTGTACAVLPIGKILYKHKGEKFETLELPPEEQLPAELNVMQRLYREISDIQYGRSKNKAGWTVAVN